MSVSSDGSNRSSSKRGRPSAPRRVDKAGSSAAERHASPGKTGTSSNQSTPEGPVAKRSAARRTEPMDAENDEGIRNLNKELMPPPPAVAYKKSADPSLNPMLSVGLRAPAKADGHRSTRGAGGVGGVELEMLSMMRTLRELRTVHCTAVRVGFTYYELRSLYVYGTVRLYVYRPRCDCYK